MWKCRNYSLEMRELRREVGEMVFENEGMGLGMGKWRVLRGVFVFGTGDFGVSGCGWRGKRSIVRRAFGGVGEISYLCSPKYIINGDKVKHNRGGCRGFQTGKFRYSGR